MIYSMTGFSALEQEFVAGVIVLELRSVNHRYLELHLKLDDALRSFEPMVREWISAKLGRGKVECRLSLMQRSNQVKQTQLDELALQQLAEISSKVQQHFPQSQSLTVADVLRWPGVVVNASEAAEVDGEALAETLRQMFKDALQAMSESREREGAKLKAVILERLAEIEQHVAQVKVIFPKQVKIYQEKLTAKLHETIKTIDEERLAQELIIYAQKVDVDEELSRLTAHVSEVKRILEAGGAAGKQLDFLMQELNREANTLGSKSVSTEVSQTSMALKILIEQMREQIQNIE